MAHIKLELTPGTYKLTQTDIPNPQKDGRNRGKDWYLSPVFPTGTYYIGLDEVSYYIVRPGKAGRIAADTVLDLVRALEPTEETPSQYIERVYGHYSAINASTVLDAVATLEQVKVACEALQSKYAAETDDHAAAESSPVG